MDIDLLIKITTLLISLLVACILMWRANKELFFGNRNSIREEYKFAKAFFDDLEKQPDMHPYARQKGFQAIAGNESLPQILIEYLLKMHDPAGVLKDYVFSRNLLEHFPTAGKNQIAFKAKYSEASRRKTLRRMYITAYGVSYTMAVSPILAVQWGMISQTILIRLLAITLPFLAVTLWSIKAVVKMNRAERLVKNSRILSSPTRRPSSRSGSPSPTNWRP